MGPQQYWKPDQSSSEQPSPVSPPAATPPTPAPAPIAPPPEVPVSAARYEGYDLTPASAQPSPGVPDQPISWDASEYIHRDKGALWYVIFGVIVIIFITISVLIQAWTFVALIIVMAIATVVYARRPPRAIHYTLTHQGLQVGQRFYSFTDFRAFGIVPDGGVFSIMLLPTKRFLPPMTIYFAEEDGEHIVDILGSSLPMERMDHDIFDRLMSRIHF